MRTQEIDHPKQTTSIPSKFRTDINGLRAWAVVAVILYHFGLPGFGGGFAGVDIFFVISGFLMTGIVVAGLEAKTFSLLKFYMARGSRILPALIALCLVLLVFGWFFLTPADYDALGTQELFSLIFWSNMKYWTQAGYFNVAAHEKWLLHTWSLSVEWQFYLLLPVGLIAIWKLRPDRRALAMALLAALLASLALCIVLTPTKPTSAFYLLPTRAWEMLAGGLTYLMQTKLALSRRRGVALEALGFALIIATCVMLDTSAQWPGYLALIPVAGTVCVLLAAQTASIWTGTAVAQWLGTRSYSLYLWHWPIVVALFFVGKEHDNIAIGIGLLATLALAQLSYHYVEAPARPALSLRGLAQGGSILLAATALAALPSGIILQQQGVQGRLPPAVESTFNEANNVKPRRDECFTMTGAKSPSCMYGGQNLRVILLGDSHADAVTTALAAAAPQPLGGVMDWSYVSCPTIFGVKKASWRPNIGGQCNEFMDWVGKQLADVPQSVPLVIVNRTSMYAFGYNDWRPDWRRPAVYFTQEHKAADPAFLREFSDHFIESTCRLAKDRPVYMMRPIPEMGVDVPRTMVRAMLLGGKKEISISLAAYHERHDFIWGLQDAAHERCGVKILNPLPYLCKDGRCNASKDGRPLYYDDNHLSEFGNRLLVPMFQEVFASKSIASASPQPNH